MPPPWNPYLCDWSPCRCWPLCPRGTSLSSGERERQVNGSDNTADCKLYSARELQTVNFVVLENYRLYTL